MTEPREVGDRDQPTPPTDVTFYTALCVLLEQRVALALS